MEQNVHLKRTIEAITLVQWRIEHHIATVGQRASFDPCWKDVGDHVKALAAIDFLAEHWFEEAIIEVFGKSGKPERPNVAFFGEERSKSADEVAHETRPCFLVDMIDGTDLLQRGFGNWCSAAVLFEPTDGAIIAAYVVLPNRCAYYATQEGAFQSSLRPQSDGPARVIWPALEMPLPNQERALQDASVCMYAQKGSRLLGLLALGQNNSLRGWLQALSSKPQGKPQETLFRFYNLAGNPMIVRIPEGAVDVVFSVSAQLPHDLVPGAFIALKAGAYLSDIAGNEITEPALQSFLKSPAAKVDGYIIAANPRLMDGIVTLLSETPTVETSSRQQLEHRSVANDLAAPSGPYTDAAKNKAPNFAERVDIELFKKQGHLDSLYVVDDYLQLHHSPGWRGWPAHGVRPLIEVGDYVPPPEMAALMERYPAKPPNNLYYALAGWDPLLTDDEELELQLHAFRGSWAFVSAMNSAWDRIDTPPIDPGCRHFRGIVKNQLLQVANQKTSLYHHIYAAVILISGDNQIVLARRRWNALYGHRWTATLEEQMLRLKLDTMESDAGDLVRCAVRGTTSELKVTVKDTKLLAFGIEWKNLAAAFLFLLRCEEPFERIVQLWPTADDANEAVALDGIQAEPSAILRALSSEVWTPSEQCTVSTLEPDAGQPDLWHPTARARLDAYLRHMQYY